MPEHSSSCGSCTITLALALLGWSTLLQWNQTRLHMDEESLYYVLPGVEESDASFVLLVSHFQAELKHVYEPSHCQVDSRVLLQSPACMQVVKRPWQILCHQHTSVTFFISIIKYGERLKEHSGSEGFEYLYTRTASGVINLESTHRLWNSGGRNLSCGLHLGLSCSYVFSWHPSLSLFISNLWEVFELKSTWTGFYWNLWAPWKVNFVPLMIHLQGTSFVWMCALLMYFSLVQFSGGSHGFPMHVESMFGDPRCICVTFEAKSAKFSASQPVRCGWLGKELIPIVLMGATSYVSK